MSDRLSDEVERKLTRLARLGWWRCPWCGADTPPEWPFCPLCPDSVAEADRAKLEGECRTGS